MDEYQEIFKDAKSHGYTDEEVTNYLLENDPDFAEIISQSKSAGYSPDEVLRHFSGVSAQPELKKETGPTSELLRHGTRTGANLATLAAGLPGSLLSLPYAGISKGLEAITGEKQTPYEESYLGKILPPVHTLKTGAQKEFPEQLTPHSKTEKFVDDIVEDVALLWNPFAKGAQVASKVPTVVRNLGKAVGANLLGEGVKEVTGSEQAGNLTKGGMLFFGSLLDSRSISKQVGDLYTDAEKAIPKGELLNVASKKPSLSLIRDRITKGRPIKNLSDDERWVVDQVKKVENLIKNGKISPEQAWAQKISLNKELQKKIYDTPWNQRKGVRNHAKQVNGWLSQVLDQYGKLNPQFGKPFKAADEAFGTLAKSNFISTWIKDNFKFTPLTHGLISLFGKGMAVGAAPVAAVAQTGKLIYRISKSPTLSKMYGKTLKAAAEEDVKAFSKYFNELDESLAKEDKSAVPPHK